MRPFRDLIKEIHRRSIWQVLGVYLMGAWGALEVVDTLVDVAGLPAWFPTLAVALLVIGLPVVLATAVVQEGIPAEQSEEGDVGARPVRREAAEPVEADEDGTRVHHRLFTWRNAIIGGVLAFALWGLVAAGWLVVVDSSALGGSGEGPGAVAGSGAEAGATGHLAVATDPPDAEIHAVRVSTEGRLVHDDSVALGTSPVTATSVAAGEYLVHVTPAGGETLSLLATVPAGDTARLTVSLAPAGGVAPGMVLVPGGTVSIGDDRGTVDSFLIDRHEVTNERYLEFVSSGGYDDPSYWPVTMLIEGEEVPREEALRHFVDRTGVPGPRSWSGGVFPEGKAEHPVVGVSWYEARGFALWEGKRLPTRDEWWRAAVGEEGRFPWGDDAASVDARANFGLEGTSPVGEHPSGVSPFGAFDMAGNVREWVAGIPPDSPDRRLAVGGSWQDPSYAFDPIFADPFPPDFTSSSVGFRCARDLTAGR